MTRRSVLFCLGLVVVGFFCQFFTQGFRLSQLLTDLPNSPDWEVSAVSVDRMREVETRLDQPFHYLGIGEQSVAFLGQDKKTVLKFFKHPVLWRQLLQILPLPARLQKLVRNFHPEPAFKSCLIAYQELQDETGVLMVHLNKTDGRWGSVCLSDPLGIQHRIDLDKTEFVVQEYGELLFTRLDREMKLGHVKEAADLTQALIDSVQSYCRKGIRIDNPAIRRNIGFRDGKVLLLDIGSFYRSEEEPQREMRSVTSRLGRWIRKHHPALFPIFTEQLARQ
jgi:hypothetical protein